MLLTCLLGNTTSNCTFGKVNVSIVRARPLFRQALDQGNFDSLVDMRLQNDYISSEMAFMAACIRHSAQRWARMS
ncbi:putative non-specific serine/threonine protein kinase [Rosa chinensis]|uniref:Putative non-specific serine/threonine protein kinase n=1 Tax=Rosa chinensis TaxID=74649 RepID=A0A2P6RWX3_ROSCH|nr:putative non-specific serine/threonine protein kinase [Rosa chinensis]